MACCEAAASGNVQLMAWMLHQPGMQLCEQAMHVAAMNGHTVMCQFLHELQCPWDASCARDAALGGH
eukprot:16383-Heterococcus_DN1.PRE.1